MGWDVLFYPDMATTLEFYGTRSTWRDVADAARTTINREAGAGEPSAAWKKRMLLAEHSPIRDTFVASYHDLFGTELKIEALHAGLECGLFSDALPGLDAIAVGPTIRGCHTPDEYLPLDSFARFYTLLTDVLARLAKR